MKTFQNRLSFSVQFRHSRELETAGAYYDKYKDFKFILAPSVLFK